jgi:peptidoglycan-N-acetylglucosamine deacetylase
MKVAAYVTTSWDDGHPLDLRLAELLAAHGVRGTFYVPRSAARETMSAAQLRRISAFFEIGAHTLHDVVLTLTTDRQAWQEIAGSKSWVEDITGLPCRMFCPPKGKYSARHIQMIREAGYLGVRSVEMLSLDFPRPTGGLALMPTSAQAFPHGPLALARNALKRKAFENLWRLVVQGRMIAWPKLASSLFRRCLERGGVFHLWGHSWELQETGQWQHLDDTLQLMSHFVHSAVFLANGEICRRLLPQIAAVEGNAVKEGAVEAQ